ncbi:MAG: GNAT family N-acetyltransferase [Pararheinheimera sp.]|jgi:GNAT superfamily N-acetyltransferase|nr:GNAT family N-acetyltransferase [Rheinheimera sp.]
MAATFTLPDGLGLRMAKPSDQPFISNLFNSSRALLRFAEAERDYIEHLIEQQFDMQSQSYAERFPNAQTLVIEKTSEPIGRIMIDMGVNLVHIIDLMLIPQAQGKGYGPAVLRAVQYVAAQQSLPVALVVDRFNTKLKTIYQSLGFCVEQQNQTHELMIWYPSQPHLYVGV